MNFKFSCQTLSGFEKIFMVSIIYKQPEVLYVTVDKTVNTSKAEKY